MMEAYTIRMPVTTCALCGDRDWRHVKVWGATGSYCRSCAWVVVMASRRHADERLAADLLRGVIRIPTPAYTPEPLHRFGGSND
jgi:hypothetical protein